MATTRFTRSDLIDRVSEDTTLTRREAEHVVHLVQDALTRALCDGQRVSIVDFGSFTARHLGVRMVRNPATGEQMEADPTARVYFRPSPTLKDFIAGKRPVPTERLVTDLRRDADDE